VTAHGSPVEIREGRIGAIESFMVKTVRRHFPAVAALVAALSERCEDGKTVEEALEEIEGMEEVKPS